MTYKQHAAVNTIVGSLALRFADWPIISKTLLPFILAGLIDADHFLYHVWKERTLSLNKLVRLVKDDWEEKVQRFYIFHTLEFGIVFTIIVYHSQLNWPWAIGYWVHMSTDMYFNLKMRRNFTWFPKWIGMLQGWQAIKAKRRARELSKGAYA